MEHIITILVSRIMTVTLKNVILNCTEKIIHQHTFIQKIYEIPLMKTLTQIKGF